MTSIYKAIVQAVLSYGAESRVVTTVMQQNLESFHHRCAYYITGQHIRENADGIWTSPKSTLVLENAGLLPIQDYIAQSKSTMK
jgi:hypothetical protein